MIATPRCLHPVRAYDLRRYPGVIQGQFTRCWRPRGHPGTKHLGRAAYERELERKRLLARERRARLPRELKPCPSEAAYRRHLRRGEVPCEGCRAEANKASDGYRRNAAGTELAA